MNNAASTCRAAGSLHLKCLRGLRIPLTDRHGHLILLLLQLVLDSPRVLADGFTRRVCRRQFCPDGPTPLISFGAMVIDFLASILRFILGAIVLELIYFVGGLVLRAASFGAVRAAPSDIPYSEFNWFCARRNGYGQIEVESTVAGGLGLIIVFICLAAFLHFF